MKARKEYATWKCRSVSIRNDWKLPPLEAPGSRPWTSRPGIKLAGLPRCERVLDTLDVCFHVACKQNPGMSVKELTDTLWCNPSQMVHRLPMSKLPSTFTWAGSLRGPVAM